MGVTTGVCELGEVYIETYSHCLFCLTKIVKPGLPIHLSSLQQLFQYLKLERKTLFDKEDRLTFPEWFKVAMGSSKLILEMCDDCCGAYEEFSRIHGKWVRLEMMMCRHLEKIYKKICESEEAGMSERFREFVEKYAFTMGWHSIAVMDKIRRETLGKCAKKLKYILPQVRIERLPNESMIDDNGRLQTTVTIESEDSIAATSNCLPSSSSSSQSLLSTTNNNNNPNFLFGIPTSTQFLNRYPLQKKRGRPRRVDSRLASLQSSSMAAVTIKFRRFSNPVKNFTSRQTRNNGVTVQTQRNWNLLLRKKIINHGLPFNKLKGRRSHHRRRRRPSQSTNQGYVTNNGFPLKKRGSPPTQKRPSLEFPSLSSPAAPAATEANKEEDETPFKKNKIGRPRKIHGTPEAAISSNNIISYPRARPIAAKRPLTFSSNKSKLKGPSDAVIIKRKRGRPSSTTTTTAALPVDNKSSHSNNNSIIITPTTEQSSPRKSLVEINGLVRSNQRLPNAIFPEEAHNLTIPSSHPIVSPKLRGRPRRKIGKKEAADELLIVVSSPTTSTTTYLETTTEDEVISKEPDSSSVVNENVVSRPIMIDRPPSTFENSSPPPPPSSTSISGVLTTDFPSSTTTTTTTTTQRNHPTPTKEGRRGRRPKYSTNNASLEELRASAATSVRTTTKRKQRPGMRRNSSSSSSNGIVQQKRSQDIQCLYCKKQIRRSQRLRHIREVHLKIRYRCSLCQKEFIRRALLANHKLLQHKSRLSSDDMEIVPPFIHPNSSNNHNPLPPLMTIRQDHHHHHHRQQRTITSASSNNGNFDFQFPNNNEFDCQENEDGVGSIRSSSGGGVSAAMQQLHDHVNVPRDDSFIPDIIDLVVSDDDDDDCVIVSA